MNPKTKKTLMLSFGLCVTVLMLWWSTRGVDWAKCREQIGAYNWLWMIPSFALFYYSMYLRAVRWGMLYRPHYSFKGYQVFAPLMICFGFNSILPGRVGEFVRAWIVGKRMKTGVPTAMATVVTERILDAVTMLGMMAVSLAMMPPVPADFSITEGHFTISATQLETGKTSIMIACGVLVAGVLVFMIPLTQKIIAKFVHAAPGIPHPVKMKIMDIIESFHKGFDALKQPGAMVQIVFLSVTLWLMAAVSNLTVAKGFGVDMSVAQAITMMTLIGIFITVPASPGYWGLYEAGGIFSLFLLQVLPVEERSLAFSLTILIHLLQYVPIVAIGLFFAWKLGVKPIDEEAIKSGEASAPSQA